MSDFSKMLGLFLFVYSIEYAGAVAGICNKAHYAGDSTCLEGYETLRDIPSCARPSEERKSWPDARKDCQNEGTDLYVADTSASRKPLLFFPYNWIGLIESPTELNKFAWLDQTEEANNIPWPKYEPAARSSRRCVYVTSVGLWRTQRCERTLNFLCQQILGPQPRRITVDIPSSTETGVAVRVFTELRITCTAYHSSDAEITFLIYPGDKSVHSTDNITRSDPRVEIKEDGVYDWDGDHCGLKTVAVLTVMAMEKHHLGYVSCCRSKPHACEESVPIKVKYLQKESETEIRPQLAKPLEKVNVSCTVYAEKKYYLTWDITLGRRKETYKVDRRGNLYQAEPTGWKLLKAGRPSSLTYTEIKPYLFTLGHRGVIYKSSVGPVIISTISLIALQQYNNTRFDCYKDPSEIKFNRAVFVKVMTSPGASISRKKKTTLAPTSSPASTPAANSTKAISDFKPYAESELCKEEDFNAKFPCDSTDFIDLKRFGTCIRFFEESLNWDSARSSCIYHHKADLVRVTTKEFGEELTDRMPNKSKNYWIGLHDRRRPGQFRWLDDNQKASWFNWEKDLPEHYKEGFSCANMKRDSGLWSHTLCRTNMFFICQKVSGRNPGKAKLDVSFPPGYDQPYVGQTMKALCSSFTYGDGNFKFGFENNETFTPISEDDSLLLQEDRAHVLDGDRCFMKSRALLHINVTKEMDGANLSCCWRHPAGFLSCTKTQHPMEIKFLSHMPVMEVGDEVLYTDDVIVVNCSAYVGTGGQLVWRLKTHSGTREWRVGLDGTYRAGETENTKNNVFNTTQSANKSADVVVVRGFKAEADDTYGPRIVSTFSLEVTSDLHGATLACVSSNPNAKDKVVTSPLFTVFSHSIQGATDSGISLSALLLWALVIAVLLALGGASFFLMPARPGVVRRKAMKRPAAPQRKKGRVGKHIKTSLLKLSKNKKKEVKSSESQRSAGSSVDWDMSTHPEGEIPDYQFGSILPSVYEEGEFLGEEIFDYLQSTEKGNAPLAGSAV